MIFYFRPPKNHKTAKNSCFPGVLVSTQGSGLAGSEGDVSLLCAAEKEEVIIAMEETWFDDLPFSELYKVPPAKVRHPDPDFGIGTYVRTNSDSGNFLYEFQNGDWLEV